MPFPVDTALGQIGVFIVVALVLCGFLLWSKRAASHRFFLGALAAMPILMIALHQNLMSKHSNLVAFTLFPVTTPGAQITVLLVAISVLIGFLVWSFDIVWVHRMFGLHHLTNTRMDLVLEPLLVVTGLTFLWFGITRERRRA